LRTGARRARVGAVGIVLALAVGALAGSASGGVDPSIGERRSGGDATVDDRGDTAFASPIPTLDRTARRAFLVGNSFFNDNWVTAPASTDARDGLGPVFNAQSCSTCHFKDGRAKPPAGADDPERGLLLRLSVPGPSPNGVVPHPRYGDQIQDRAIEGVPAEATVLITTDTIRGRYADGTPFTLLQPRYEIVDASNGPLGPEVLVSPRIAPAVIGVGLLEAIPEATVRAAADPADADGDGVSGRVNTVLDEATGTTALGRFGWKANVPTVAQQNAGAFVGDIGITSARFPEQPCAPGEDACLAAPHGGTPELDDAKLERVTFYTRTLAVPARRAVKDPAVVRGERVFRDAGCAACHTPTLETGDSDVPGLAHQTIHPFTDLLLHDMGPGLADGRPDADASGSEWRTPPLWGIGLVETVNGHTRFLHDGRARGFAEAILWHGGEGERAKQRFRRMPRVDRQALVAYLESL
jgi:CxxC motif-containing protein (DUF1111 family)